MAAKSTSDDDDDDNIITTPFPPDPNSPQSTINTVEREIREAGGEATAIAVDVRDYRSVEELVRKTIEVCKNRMFFSPSPPSPLPSLVPIFPTCS